MVFNETFRLDAFARALKDLEERACQIEIIKLILQDTDPEETLSQPRRNLQANLSGIRSQQKCLQDIEGKFKTDISISDVETALTQAKSEIQNADKGIAYALKNSPIITNKPTTNDFETFVTGYLRHKASVVSCVTEKLYWKEQDTLKYDKLRNKLYAVKVPQYGQQSRSNEESDLHYMIQKIEQWGAKKAYVAHIGTIVKNANNVIDMCETCLEHADALRDKEQSEKARDNQIHNAKEEPQRNAHAALGKVFNPKENLSGQEMHSVVRVIGKLLK